MLHLEIVTPEKKVFSDTVVDVYLPGIDGEFGVLSLHEAVVASLAPGELRYHKDGTEHHMAIGSGFVEVSGDHVSVLTDMALGESEIDEATAEEAVRKAEETMKNTDMLASPEEFAHLQGLLAANLAKLNYKRRRR
jgi:F-type H+-transporting ATPase subunit epsilon